MLPSVLIIIVFEALILVLGLFIVVYHYYNIIIAKVNVEPVYEVNPIQFKVITVDRWSLDGST